MREVLERTTEGIFLGELKKIRVVFKPVRPLSERTKGEIEKRLKEILKRTIKSLLAGKEWGDSIYIPIDRYSELEISIYLEESYWEDEEELVLVYWVEENEYRYDFPIF